MQVAWARILSRVPEVAWSSNTCVASLITGSASKCGGIRLCQRGSSAASVLWASPNLDGHWRVIGGVDLVLDPFPYQGTHTTLECLTMGVPVLTLIGETCVRRCSSSPPLRLGLEDLVTQNVDEYVERGVARPGTREAAAVANRPTPAVYA